MNKQSSTSSSKENISENKSTVENMPENTPEETSESRPATSSPEPNCAICLEPLQNKSLMDSCFHTFCFTCLLEWSKVKPECPLCKQQFTSILYNFKNDSTFEIYYINSKNNKQLWPFLSRTEYRFRYPTTMTAARILERNRSSNQESYENQINSHRMRYAPHSVRLYSNSQMIARTPCPFRRRVYRENLWVKPSTNARVRLVSPEFFKINPACTHRLLPWLNRELVSLWQDNEAHVTFVLELIMSLVVRYDITSEEFLIHIEPYMGNNTHHFIHEFYNFAISPHDMENYDLTANYNTRELARNDRSSSSPDSDVIPIFSAGYISNASQPKPKGRKKHHKRSEKLKKLVLKKKSEDSWESILAPITSAHFPSGSIFANPGPSTSRIGLFNILLPNQNVINMTSDNDPTDDDEVQVLDVLKPRHERTPEIVELSSGEDEPKPKTVIDVSSGEESPTCRPTCPSPMYSPTFPSYTRSGYSSSDVECVYEYDGPSTTSPMLTPASPMLTPASPMLTPASPLYSPTSPMCTPASPTYSPKPPSFFSPTNYSSSDVECVYEYDRPTTSKEMPSEKNSGTSINNLENRDKTDAYNVSHNEGFLRSGPSNPKKYPKLASAIVRPWTMENESSHKPLSSSKFKRHLASSYLDDSLTESCSDTGYSSERKAKKLKLRSVVAHFSIDTSDSRHDSNHRSSHKKHKDKRKKKKKKHVHRHKHRIYSDSDSG
ncbi:hypothetical protein NPIL_306011 [Nephila pilipes]|uniref:E3 ubiquitin-protein ligase Topors n=1 Tax=Nephila pilipes TaxID=299642 RepID=A0A8X6N2I3_NEPPI|nr:hypothetical protein NPIL_306011 [Nephila pilipes]